ncbi:MAG: hypothetical protein P4L56_00150 [Candidatus Sulfopaludibacter sp.]|nr:hypothetical protein [Candidatus Sulfopaludibacter sp.]
MDKRREPRFAAEQCVTIVTLGERQLRQTAIVRNASGTGLGLFVKTEIGSGTVLRIELEDAIVLGEAMYCRAMESGYFVGVQLEQVLRGLGELHRCFREFREEEKEDPVKPR